MDYQGNSKKAKTPKEDSGEPKKEIQKVVVGEVVVKKKSLGQKIKDTFVEADFKSVAHFVVTDVLIPAARNMIVDSATKGIERMMYGERGHGRTRYSSGSRAIYQSSPLRTDYRHPSTRPPSQIGRQARMERNEFVLETQSEAEAVLQSMHDIIEQYEVVSVADLNELVGFPSSHIDHKWGWVYLGNVSIRHIREGFLIDLPPAEPI